MADINVTLVLDDRQYTGKLKAAGALAEEAGRKITTAAGAGNTAFARLGTTLDLIHSKFGKLSTVISAGAFAALGRHALNSADEIVRLSEATDVSIAKIIQMRAAFESSGGRADDLSKMLSKLSQTLYEAQTGGKKAQEDLLKLGITFSDMANMGTEEAMGKIIERLASMNDPIKRNALAFEVFGKSARTINWESIQRGTQGVTAEAEKQAQALRVAADANDKLAVASQNLATAFAQVLEKSGILAGINKLSTDTETLKGILTGVGAVFAVVFGAKTLAAIWDVVKAVEAMGVALLFIEKGTAIGRIASIVATIVTAIAAYAGAKTLLEKMLKEDPNVPKPNEPTQTPQTGTNPAITPAWEAEVKGLQQLSDAYERNAGVAMAKYNRDSALIGESEDHATKVKALADVYDQLQSALYDAQKQEEKILAMPVSQERADKLAAIQAEIKQIEELGQKRVKQAEEDIAYRVKQTQKYREYLINLDAEISQREKLTQIRNNVELIGLNELEQAHKRIEQTVRAEAQAEIDAENKRQGMYGVKLTKEQEQAYFDKYQSKIKILKDETTKEYEAQRSFTTGWKKAFNDYIDNATNAARVTENIFKKALGGMEDAIVSFAKTGKFEWKGFISMMMEELLRSQIQQLFANMLGGVKSSMSGFMPGESGGIPQSSGGLLGGIIGIGSSILSGVGKLFGGLFANGGQLGAGKWGIAGEAGPELISGPAMITPMNKLNGGVTNVVYNINAVDARSFKQLVAQDPSFIHAVAQQGAKSIPSTRR